MTSRDAPKNFDGGSASLAESACDRLHFYLSSSVALRDRCSFTSIHLRLCLNHGAANYNQHYHYCHQLNHPRHHGPNRGNSAYKGETQGQAQAACQSNQDNSCSKGDVSPCQLPASSESRTDSVTSMNTNATQSPLLRLSAELRNRVYKLVLGGHDIHIGYDRAGKELAHSICVAPHRNDSTGDDTSDNPTYKNANCHGRCLVFANGACKSNRKVPVELSLLRVCKQIHEEAALLPFMLNTFLFERPLVPLNSRIVYLPPKGKPWPASPFTCRHSPTAGTLTCAKRTEPTSRNSRESPPSPFVSISS